MSYKPQEMDNNGYSNLAYALISITTWSVVTIGNVQTFVSILGGLIAAVSGIVSLYKSFNKPK